MKTIKECEDENNKDANLIGYWAALKDVLKLIDEFHQRSLISYTTYLELKQKIQGGGK